MVYLDNQEPYLRNVMIDRRGPCVLRHAAGERAAWKTLVVVFALYCTASFGVTEITQLAVGSVEAPAGAPVLVPLSYEAPEEQPPAVIIARLAYPAANITILDVAPDNALSGAGKMLDYEIGETMISIAVFGGTEAAPPGTLLYLVGRVADEAPAGAPLTFYGEAHGADVSAAYQHAVVVPGGIMVSDALARHSADTTDDWRISLEEVLRVIQLYNAGEYHCDPSEPDGYAPGVGARTCSPHDADYSPADWRISLTELLRMIQFYNAPYGAYHRNETTEDGFAAGPFGFEPSGATP